ncbi:LOW QUALITY PROTEIN: uncharacterized protein LOC117345115 [Pecten maximus]|uniref:LOW QUALITY PROTEIN: uncharacterized protein LOC117345115 n=1 Tax=Pecten maximus TaxID=6579 RepID=UPI0014584888|nr:LOW QUALITY PROTEIN: uncharacterized protein LOC117345115 [Pecten maximus]
MSHRRKNAHPLNKQKRIGSVVDRVLAAKTREYALLSGEKEPVSQPGTVEQILKSNESLSTNRMSPAVSTDGSSQSSFSTLLDSSNQNIAIPDDLFKDFQALKSATHLDTTELMRKLLKEYTSGTESDAEGASSTDNRKSPGMEQNQDVSSLSEYYKTEPVDVTKSETDLAYQPDVNEPLDLSTIKTEKEDKYTGFCTGITPASLNRDSAQQVNVRQGSTLFPTNIETQKSQPYFGAGSPGVILYPFFGSGPGAEYPLAVPGTSMKVPTVMHPSVQGDREQTVNLNVESPEQLHETSPTVQTENNFPSENNYREVQFQNGSVKIKGTKLHPEIQVGDLQESGQNIPVENEHSSIQFQNISPKLVTNVTNAESGAVVMPTDATPVPIAAIPTTREMMQNLSPIQQPSPQIAGVLPTPMTQTDLSNMTFAENYAAATAQYQMQEFQKPTKVSGKSPKNLNKKSGQMKLIAENTSHHGVYTSVLKLPWSRRTRTPKADNGEKSSQQQQKLLLKQQQLQQQQQQQQLLQQQQQQAQQPLMLLPVATTNLPSSQAGVFIPATNFTMPTVASHPSDSSAMSGPLTSTVTTPAVTPITTPTSTQPMMMVYPNATFGTVNKPVRKRGRPPKVPVLARMLAEANKRAALDMQQIPNFFQNFPACQQPAAIVLNVNNMVNPAVPGSITTLNPVTSSSAIPNNPPAVVTAPTDTVPIEQIPIQHHTLDLQQPLPVLSGQIPIQQVQTPDVVTPASIAHSLENDPRYRTLSHAEVSGQTLSKPSPDLMPKPPQPPQPELKTLSSTSVSSNDNGALYQEMILSSKALVNVKPRRRQTTTELLKSKSGADSFICTSFRLRSLPGKAKEKRTAVVTGMKRRGRPPKRRLMGMFDHQIDGMGKKTTDQLPSQIPISDSQTIAQLYGESNLDALHSPTEIGQTSLNLTAGDDLDRCPRSLSNSEEPRLFDGEIDSNYDNPLLANQFGVEGSLSDGCLPQDPTQGRFIFSSDDDEARLNREQKLSLGSDLDRDDSSNEDNDCLSNDMFSKLFHCKVCNEIIPVEKKNEHWEKHARVKVKCVTCSALCHKFLTKEQMASDSARENLQCDNCERSTEMDVADHSLSTVVQCEICQESFPDGRTLKRHIKVEHPGTYALQKAKLMSIRKHTDDHQQPNPKSHELKVYWCPVEECQKKFYSKFRIKLHMKKWHTNRQGSPSSGGEGGKKKGRGQYRQFNVKGYTCSWPGCDEEFQTERNLKVHLLLHRDEKPLKCDFCDYRCRQRTALGWHTRKHHPEASNVLMTYTQSGSAESSEPGEENGVE